MLTVNYLQVIDHEQDAVKKEESANGNRSSRTQPIKSHLYETSDLQFWPVALALISPWKHLL